MFGGDEVGSMVIDIGTSFSRVGFAGEDVPKAVFQTPVGEVRSSESKSGEGSHLTQRYCIARQKQIHREHMEITNPLVNGLVENWDALERIWDYTLRTHLNVEPSEHPLMISESNYNTADRRERMMELAFEKFEVPASFLCKSAVLSAFSMGRPTALVLDVGGGCSTAVPVHDGFVLHKGLRRTKASGATVDELVEKEFFTSKQREIPTRYNLKREVHPMGRIVTQKLDLANTTNSYDRFMKMQVLRDVKESLCRVSETTFDLVRNANIPKDRFELPDGKIIEAGAEKFAITECLFKPTSEFQDVIGADFPDANFQGLHRMVAEGIDACDVDVRKELYTNIVLTGAGSLFPGLERRLHNEVNHNLSPAFRVKVMTPATAVERKFGAWIGGSILGSLGSFHQMWFSKAEYDEQGAALLAQKCP